VGGGAGCRPSPSTILCKSRSQFLVIRKILCGGRPWPGPSHHFFGVAVVIIPACSKKLIPRPCRCMCGWLRSVLHRSDVQPPRQRSRACPVLPSTRVESQSRPQLGLGDHLFRQRRRGRRHGGLFYDCLREVYPAWKSLYHPTIPMHIRFHAGAQLWNGNWHC